MSRQYFLRKLRSFKVCSTIMEMFYQSVVAQSIFFAGVFWGRASDTNRRDKMIKKTGSVLGAVVVRRTLKKCSSLTMISTFSVTQ